MKESVKEERVSVEWTRNSNRFSVRNVERERGRSVNENFTCKKKRRKAKIWGEKGKERWRDKEREGLRGRREERRKTDKMKRERLRERKGYKQVQTE